MGIFVPGRTRCPLCRAVVEELAGTRSFPPILPRQHPLALVCEATVHDQCFENWSGRLLFEHLLSRFHDIWKGRPVRVASDELDRWQEAAQTLFAVEVELLDKWGLEHVSRSVRSG